MQIAWKYRKNRSALGWKKKGRGKKRVRNLHPSGIPKKEKASHKKPRSMLRAHEVKDPSGKREMVGTRRSEEKTMRGREQIRERTRPPREENTACGKEGGECCYKRRKSHCRWERTFQKEVYRRSECASKNGGGKGRINRPIKSLGKRELLSF